MSGIQKKDSNKSISDKFTSELLNPTIDLTVDYAEIYLDDFMDNPAVKEIPIVKSIVGTIKMAFSVNDFFFAKKLLTFIQRVNKRSIDAKTKDKFHDKIHLDSSFKKKVTEQTMVFIDRHVIVNKTKVLAELFTAFVEEKISFEEYTSLAISLERIHPDSFGFLKYLSQTDFEVKQEKDVEKKFDEQALLLASGIARETSAWSHGFIVSENGKKLYKLGIEPLL
jgi:hypothetical protein